MMIIVIIFGNICKCKDISILRCVDDVHIYHFILKLWQQLRQTNAMQHNERKFASFTVINANQLNDVIEM